MNAQSPLALILVGESEFWDRLRLQSFTAIRQRIDIQFKLGYYERAQVGEYVATHLKYAGVDQQFFSDGALDVIHHFLEEPQGS
jgi:general secretion pathway protein A